MNLIKSLVLIATSVLTTTAFATSIHTIELVQAESINTNEIINLAKIDVDHLLQQTSLTTVSVQQDAQQQLALQTEELAPSISLTNLVMNAE